MYEYCFWWHLDTKGSALEQGAAAGLEMGHTQYCTMFLDHLRARNFLQPCHVKWHSDSSICVVFLAVCIDNVKEPVHGHGLYHGTCPNRCVGTYVISS